MRRHEHSTPSKGTKRYQCPNCQKTFVETLDTIYYHRHIDAEQIHLVLHSHWEGVSQRGIARLTGLAYNTVVSIIIDTAIVDPNGAGKSRLIQTLLGILSPGRQAISLS